MRGGESGESRLSRFSRTFHCSGAFPGTGGVGRRNYHRPVGLSLIVGPANAGKVELLLDRYVAALDRDPYLIVPGRPDVDRVERELLARCHGLLGGDIGTFDDLFARIAAGDSGRRPVATDTQRTLAVRRAIAATDLARLAERRIDELPPAEGIRAPALAYLERRLFEGPAAARPELEGTIRFFEGAGVRGVLELVGEELLDLIRGGRPADRIAVVCPSLERWRAPLETALATLGVPYAVEDRLRLGQTPLGHALLSLLRFAWLDGSRRDLFSFLRPTLSGLSRASVDL